MAYQDAPQLVLTQGKEDSCIFSLQDRKNKIEVIWIKHILIVNRNIQRIGTDLMS